MARNAIVLVLFSISILLIVGGVESYHRCSKVRAFVRASCSETRYPRVCEQTLMGHVNSTNQSHNQLAQIALRVSLARARFARAYLTTLANKLKGSSSRGLEYEPIQDCIDQIGNSVDQLRQSLLELQRYNYEQEGVDDFMWHMSNIVSWTSAALTDQTACAEAFSGVGHRKGVKAVVNGKVDDVAQVTSNALALVNRFVTTHRFHRGVHRP